MPNPKQLIVLSLDPHVHKHLVRVLAEVLEKVLQIDGCSVNDCQPRQKQPDAVLISGAFLYEQARELFPDVPIIVPERVISGKNLEQVALLPKGSRAVVVTTHKAATEDTIRGLEQLGLNHLEYVSYETEGNSFTGSEAVITPGLLKMIPEGATKVIDIGNRLISTFSFLKVLMVLKLDMHYLDHYAHRFHRSMAESTLKLVTALETLEIKQIYEKIILDEFEDGVFSLNQNGEVEIVNQAALKILGTSAENTLGKSYLKVNNTFKFMANLIESQGGGNRSSAIYEHKEKQLVQTIIPVQNDNYKATIVTLKEIDSIKKIEEDVRMGLHRKGLVAKYGFSDIITASPVFRRLLSRSKSFANTSKNILITGESGTGKELIAHAIHRESTQWKGPFVAVNFAGIPESLVESELFGYEEGAFTGAMRGGKKGLFEYAHGGTMFLDEIGDAPPALQARLLRVLQEKEVRRVGGIHIIPISVRIIAATNTDLSRAILEKTFRKDLFFRLSTLPIHIPPLRERREDILLLFDHYLKNAYNINKKCSPRAVSYLLKHTWPGNIRELFNIAEYLCLSSEGRQTIEAEDFPTHLLNPLSVRKMNLLKEMEIHQEISSSGIKSELLESILTQIGKYGFQGVGRRKLQTDLARTGTNLSEATLRRIQLKLSQLDLVKIGSTRQGTMVTDKGEELLDLLCRMHH